MSRRINMSGPLFRTLIEYDSYSDLYYINVQEAKTLMGMLHMEVRSIESLGRKEQYGWHEFR